MTATPGDPPSGDGTAAATDASALRAGLLLLAPLVCRAQWEVIREPVLDGEAIVDVALVRGERGLTLEVSREPDGVLIGTLRLHANLPRGPGGVGQDRLCRGLAFAAEAGLRAAQRHRSASRISRPSQEGCRRVVSPSPVSSSRYTPSRN